MKKPHIVKYDPNLPTLEQGAAESAPQRFIVIDEYGLPCSQPVSKKLAESLASALNKLGGGRCFTVRRIK